MSQSVAQALLPAASRLIGTGSKRVFSDLPIWRNHAEPTLNEKSELCIGEDGLGFIQLIAEMTKHLIVCRLCEVMQHDG